jgi:hypothetical protein
MRELIFTAMTTPPAQARRRTARTVMRVRDGLYGNFAVPDYLVELLLTPEVYRLSQIRLINTPSPSFAALADVRRFSHTLGVLYLCQLARRGVYSTDEWRAFELSVLLHDVGSAPFGHLFEYHLAERTRGGWNHERMIQDVLASVHAPENSAHQIYAKRTVRLRKQAQESGIDLRIVEAIISNAHPLSKLLFGTLDLDNLDNVARMAWALGLVKTGDLATAIAKSLTVGRDGDLLLDEVTGQEKIREWLRIRRAVYNVLLYDMIAVSLQAVLSEVIGTLVKLDKLEAADWTLTDEQLLDRLLTNPQTKTAMMTEYFGTPPSAIFCVRLNSTLARLGIKDRTEAKRVIESSLKVHFPNRTPLGYVILDQGTFEKRVEFTDPDTKQKWSAGRTTESTLFYGFVRGRGGGVTPEACAGAAAQLLQQIGGLPESSAEVHLGCGKVENDDQRTLAFETEEYRLGLL